MHFDILVRTIVVFFALLLFTRLLGRKQMSHLTFFNYITGISIGTISASLAMDRTLDIWDASTALVGWVALTLVIDFIDIKSRRLRVLLDGQPLVVIQNGQVLDKALRRARLDMEELSMLLRQKNVFSITDVDYAVMETDGQLSLLKKQGKQTPTKTDLKIPTPTKTIIPVDLIIDGKLINENLVNAGVSEAWLKHQITAMGISPIENVFYAQLQKDGTLYVDLMDDAPKGPM